MRDFTFNTLVDDNCFARFEGSPYTARWTKGERVASVFFGVSDPVGRIESSTEFTRENMQRAITTFYTKLKPSDYILSKNKESLIPVTVSVK